MPIPILDPLIRLGETAIDGISSHFKSKQMIKKAITANKCRLAANEQTHNNEWEMKQLDNSGWKDDVLFYAWILFFAWTAYDPDSAKKVFDNWELLPEWFIEISGWIIGSVIGVRKLAETVPSLLRGVKEAVIPKKNG